MQAGTLYVLTNPALPGESIKRFIPAGESLSPYYAAEGWTVQSSSTTGDEPQPYLLPGYLKQALDAGYAPLSQAVPAGGTGGTFLRGDGAWATPASAAKGVHAVVTS
jgi:hypothetical protein